MLAKTKMPTIRNFVYASDLILRRWAKGDGRLFYVDQPFSVHMHVDGDPFTIIVPPGFPTDLASIPDIIPPFIVQRLGPHIEAAVVHDWIYATQDMQRALADEIFLAGMLAAGVPAWKAHMMHRAVRLGGGAAWAGKPARPEFDDDIA